VVSLEISLEVFTLMASKEGGIFFACPPLTSSPLRRFMACLCEGADDVAGRSSNLRAVGKCRGERGGRKNLIYLCAHIFRPFQVINLWVRTSDVARSAIAPMTRPVEFYRITPLFCRGRADRYHGM
jgi:hypothetical protein